MSKKYIIKLNKKCFENFEDSHENDSNTNDIDSSSNASHSTTSHNSKNVGGICTSNPTDWSDDTKINCSDNNMNENSMKKKFKRSKKTKEGFCVGKTCLSENNLKSLIKLLKKLELKK